MDSSGHIGLLEDHAAVCYSSFVRHNEQPNGFVPLCHHGNAIFNFRLERCNLDYCKTMAIVLKCLEQVN